MLANTNKYFFDENSVDIRSTVFLPLIAASPPIVGFICPTFPNQFQQNKTVPKKHNTEPGSAKGQQQKWRQPTSAALDAGAEGRGPPGGQSGGEFYTDPSRSVFRADWRGGAQDFILFFDHCAVRTLTLLGF